MFLWQYFWMRLNWWTLSNADHSMWCGWALSNQCKALLEQSDLLRGRRKYSSILGIFQLGIASLSWFSSLLTYSGDFGFNKLQKIVWDNTLKKSPSLPSYILLILFVQRTLLINICSILVFIQLFLCILTEVGGSFWISKFSISLLIFC